MSKVNHDALPLESHHSRSIRDWFPHHATTSRRVFLKTCGLSAAASLFMQQNSELRGEASSEPVSTAKRSDPPALLKTAIETGMDNLIATTQSISVNNPEEVAKTGHAKIWAFNIRHNVGRTIDGLLLGNAVVGKSVPEELLNTMRRYLFASLDNPTHLNGAYSIRERRLQFHAHDVREAILSLTALMRYRDDEEARKRGIALLERLRQLILPDGTWNVDEVSRFPDLAHGHFSEQIKENGKLFNIACWTRGRWIMALCKYYRLTQDARALELAERLVRLVRKVSFREDGTIQPTEFPHTHSITGTVHGLIDYGQLAGDEETREHGRRIYDNGLSAVSASYGWSTEAAWGDPKLPNRGEVNNTGDMVQAALLLGRSGLPHYFQDAERRICGHLLPSQCTDGGWGFPGPNDREGGVGVRSVFDITAGAIQALCETALTLVVPNPSGVQINMPMTNWIGPASVESRLPDKWQLNVTVAKSGNVSVRIPSWAQRDKVQVTTAGQPRRPVFNGTWLNVESLSAGSLLTVTLPLVEREEMEQVNHQPYRVLWRGDQVVAISPSGKVEPIFPSIEAYRSYD